MNYKCIYSLKGADEATFNSREHIIPACIGGMKKLPKGYVSDQANEMFSKMELEFARNTEISMMREMLGPGKKGSLNPKKATSSKIRLMQNKENSEYNLGYLQLGKPCSISQIHVYEHLNKIRFSLVPNNDINNNDNFYSFWNKLQNLINVIAIEMIISTELNETEFILGCHKDKWYLAMSETQCSNKYKNHVITFVKQMIKAHECNAFVLPIHELENAKPNLFQTSMSYQFAFNYEDRYRVIAKIAFNGLAHLMGNTHVLKHEYDPIRNAIYQGNDMHRFFDMMNYSSECNSFEDIFRCFDTIQNKTLGEWFHGLIYFGAMGNQKCAVGLYGLKRPHIINLAKNIYNPFFGGFFCNWKEKQEMDMMEYINVLLNNPTNV